MIKKKARTIVLFIVPIGAVLFVYQVMNGNS